MTARETEEYRAMRATIRQRGTARVWLAVFGLTAWSALAVATTGLMAVPVMMLAPLVALAAAFEAVFALHTGTERVGRYLQVYFEDTEAETATWETVAMTFGQRFPGVGPDPLFVVLFLAAAVVNMLLASSVGPVASEWSVLGASHVAFATRVLIARRHASTQRRRDLERFSQIKGG